jgi:hypothetical protein
LGAFISEANPARLYPINNANEWTTRKAFASKYYDFTALGFLLFDEQIYSYEILTTILTHFIVGCIGYDTGYDFRAIRL